MTTFSVRVSVDEVEHLQSAWVALAGLELHPALPTVELEPGHRVGPIGLWVQADSAELAEARITEALHVLPTGSFEVTATARAASAQTA